MTLHLETMGPESAAAHGAESAARRPGVFGAAVAGLSRQLAAERDRWGLWLPVAFGAGIAGYFALGREPPGWLGGVALAGAVALSVLCRRRVGPLVAAIALAAVGAGFAAAQLRTALVAAPVLQARLGPVTVHGRVVVIEPRLAGRRAILDDPRIDRLAPGQTPARVRVTLRGDEPTIRPGDWLRLRAILLPPPEPAAPGAFDFARQAYFQRIGAIGFTVGSVAAADPPATPAAAETGAAQAWRLWWAAARQSISARILAALPGQAGAVATALMTGERGAIAEPVLAAMRDSGLAHLLAISGLHVGLVAGLLFFGVRAALALVPWLALRFPIRKWAAAVAALGAVAYLMLTGASFPTQRAVLMIGLVLLAVVLDRTALSPRLVAWAAVAVLLVAPDSLLSASFQMSFAAVVALIAGYEALRDRRGRTFRERSPVARAGVYAGGVAVTSLIAGLATAPFAVYHFNRIAWYGLAGNMAAVPLTALWIMPWAVVAFLLMPFGAERLALVPMGWGIEAMLFVARWVADWPGAVSLVRAMPTAGLVLITLGGLWLCLWRRPWRLAGLAPMLAGALSVAASPPPDILVSGDGRLFAIRTADGELLLSSGRARSFDAEVWQRRVGEAGAATWPRTGAAADGRLRCDPLGCIYRAKGQVVALVQDSRALDDDCAAATVVVSREPIGRGACGGANLRIDRFDLWRQGGHAVWLSETGAHVETVAGQRGRRPWTTTRGRGAR